MDDGMQWLAGTILSAVISSVITVGFLSYAAFLPFRLF